MSAKSRKNERERERIQLLHTHTLSRSGPSRERRRLGNFPLCVARAFTSLSFIYTLLLLRRLSSSERSTLPREMEIDKATVYRYYTYAREIDRAHGGSNIIYVHVLREDGWWRVRCGIWLGNGGWDIEVRKRMEMSVERVCEMLKWCMRGEGLKVAVEVKRGCRRWEFRERISEVNGYG